MPLNALSGFNLIEIDFVAQKVVALGSISN